MSSTTFRWLAALLLGLSAVTSAQTVAVIAHRVPGFLETARITAGPDGALWFTAPSRDRIGRITTAGEVTGFLVPTSNSWPFGITTGPDGALWFTENQTKSIGRITTAGAITEYSLPNFLASPLEITTGPDLALWFTSSNAIGRITTDGAVSAYPLPLGVKSAAGITAGPDGALWFTENQDGRIGRITTAGVITEYSLPNASSYPISIVSGPDGALWFTEHYANRIGRITPEGAITEYDLPQSDSEPNIITSGPDGALWFTEVRINMVGRITTAGVITEYSTSFPYCFPSGIAAGPDGAIWFGAFGARVIGQAVFTTAVLTADPIGGSPGSSVTRTGNGFDSGESVNFYANSTSANLVGTTVADAQGSFIAPGRVREGPYGAYSVAAVGQTSGKIGVAPFFVTATLVLGPGSVPPGGEVVVQGFGFAADERVRFYWNDRYTQVEGVAQTDARGRFSGDRTVTLTVPANAPPGPNVVYGYGLDSEAVGKGYVNVQ